MTDTLIDFSAAFPAPQAVKDAGHRGVICYVSDSRPGTNFGAKPLTRAAADSYRAAGLEVVSCYQKGKGTTSDWRGGYDAGVTHARRALELHRAAGGPDRRPIYAPVDDNPTLAEYNTLIAPFLRGWESVVGHEWTGVYGNSLVHAWAQEDGLGSWWWLHGWGGDRTPDGQTHLQQVEIDKRQVGGVGVDLNVILRADYGQWSAANAPAPQPASEAAVFPVETRNSPNQDNRPRNVSWLCLHTQEGGDANADSLANYCCNPASQVSYNSVSDSAKIINIVPFDSSPWAALGANGRADHLCMAGTQAAWSRQRWLDSGRLPVAAYWCAQRIKARSGTPNENVGVGGVQYNRKGIICHWDWTRGAGEGSHTDVGSQFPWDVLHNLIQQFLDGRPPAQVAGAIGELYQAIGGEASFLGKATTAELGCPDQVGRYNHFERGSIYWTPALGAHECHDLIHGLWSSVGWETGILGYPITNETTIPGGAFNHFERGSIYWSAFANVVCEVHGRIRDKWAETGWENGPLGFPITNETPLPGGAFNHFQAGSIYWSPATDAHEVHGLIRDAYAMQGWETGPLGFPTSDEYDCPRGRRSDFQGGSLVFHSADFTVTKEV